MLGFAVPAASFTISGTTIRATIAPTARAHCTMTIGAAGMPPGGGPPAREGDGEHQTGDEHVVHEQRDDQPRHDRRILARGDVVQQHEPADADQEDAERR